MMLAITYIVSSQGSFVVRKFSTLCSPLPIVEEKSLELSQKSVLVMGRAKFDIQKDMHTMCESLITMY